MSSLFYPTSPYTLFVDSLVCQVLVSSFTALVGVWVVGKRQAQRAYDRAGCYTFMPVEIKLGKGAW